MHAGHASVPSACEGMPGCLGQACFMRSSSKLLELQNRCSSSDNCMEGLGGMACPPHGPSEPPSPDAPSPPGPLPPGPEPPAQRDKMGVSGREELYCGIHSYKLQ